MNDRALREIVNSLGGVANGFPREDGFDITVASEVMAILCLSLDLKDLERRLGNIIVGYTRDKTPIRARELKADGAMTVLLKDALMPNLVQTLENNPVFIHGGPFANIAHGCNSVLATKSALKIADFVVTEAGFGADLGAEKFFDIKCRKAGLTPDVAVVVATVRALKMHGGVSKENLKNENVLAVNKGCENLLRHLENMAKFGVPVAVAINRFVTDTEAEVQEVMKAAESVGARAFVCTHWADGGAGTEQLARHVVELAETTRPTSSRSMPTTCRCATRSRRSPPRSTAPPTSPAIPPSKRRSRISRRAASATCRCAWPRRSTRSRPTPPSAARRPGTSCRCASCACRPAPSSSSSSPARS